MALILWTDTFATLSDVNSLLAGNATWDSYDDVKKESAIKRATAQINALIHADGTAQSEGQALQFPRTYSHAMALSYPDQYSTAAQTRKLALAIAEQIEYTFSRVDVGTPNYSSPVESFQNRDPAVILWKAIMHLQKFIVRKNALIF